LKARCKAIQNALKKYNTMAVQLRRPVLDWKSISAYGTLAEFSLLRECREDIRAQPWAQAANRQAGIYRLKLTHANEERERLNIEVRRVATSIRDEELDFERHITRLEETDILLATELRDIRDRRVRVNRQHRARIAEIYKLPCYNGIISLGTRVGRAGIEISVDEDVSFEDREDDEEPEPDEDDIVVAELQNVEQFFEQLSIPTADDE
jgi:hypothetical protein